MPPSSSASRRPGGKLGAGRSLRAQHDRGADVLGLAGVELRRAFEPPRGVGRLAAEAALTGRREQPLGEQRARGEHQQLERALDVRGALGEEARREDVDLPVRHGPDDVATCGGGGAGALERQPRLGRIELGAGGVDDDRELAGSEVEPPLELPPRVLELGEDALRVVGIAVVVARDERLGGGLEPAHARRIVAAAATPAPGPRTAALALGVDQVTPGRRAAGSAARRRARGPSCP